MASYNYNMTTAVFERQKCLRCSIQQVPCACEWLSVKHECTVCKCEFLHNCRQGPMKKEEPEKKEPTEVEQLKRELLWYKEQWHNTVASFNKFHLECDRRVKATQELFPKTAQ